MLRPRVLGRCTGAVKLSILYKLSQKSQKTVKTKKPKPIIVAACK